MKVVYLTLEAPREGQASYVHVHEIIAGLKKQGADVTLYQPPYTGKPVSPKLFVRLFYALFLQIKLWVQWPCGSVLYVRGHYLAFPSAVIATLFGIPIIHEINGPYEDVFVTYPALKYVRKILIFMQRWQYRKATSLIAVTEELQRWANAEGLRDDCVFISNGANVDIFKPVEEGSVRPVDVPDRYVVFFGGLTRWHGVPTMIAAVNHDKWPSDVQLVVIGDGQEVQIVKDAVAENDNIIYLGRKPYMDVAAYVAYAMAGLVTISDPDQRSSTGVFPLKLFETLACGVPVIVTDLPGQADFVREHSCGFVIPIDDALALADCVAVLSKDPKQAGDMGSKGRQAVVKECSWFARSQATLAVINVSRSRDG